MQQAVDHDAIVPFYRACHNIDGTPKVRYGSWQEADRVAWKLEQRDGIPLYVYWCPVCDDGTWHVGHAREDA